MGRRAKANKASANTSAPPPPIDRSPVPRPALIAAIVLAAVCLAHPLLNDRPYPAELPKLWVIGSGSLILLAVVLAELDWKWARELPRRGLAILLRPVPSAFAWGLALFAFGMSVLVAVYSFDRFPTTADEIAQLWHARILLEGRLALPPDPNPEFFAIDNVIDQGRWYSEYPIGGPAILAIGTLIGAPWLINPLLCAGTAVAIFQFARRVYPEGEARAIGLLFCLSPMVLMIAGSHMNHVPVLFFAAWTLVALAEWDAPRSPRHATMAAGAIGLLLGAMATVRPLDAAVFAGCVAVFQIARIARDRGVARLIPVQLVAGCIAIAPLLYANWRTTGHPLRFGYEALWGAGHGLGFHVDPTGAEHTPRRAVGYAAMYVSQLNVYAFTWPAPIMAIVVAALASMRRFTRWDALLLGLFVTQVVAYAMYWHNGQFIGPRFLYTALLSLVIILARTPFIVGDRFGAYWRRISFAFMAACVVVGCQSVWKMANVYRDTRVIVKNDYAQVARDAGLTNALVFLREAFGHRLLHRLWAVGMPRSESTVLIARNDGCSVFEALRKAEADSTGDRASRLAMIRRSAIPFVESDSSMRGKDGLVRFNSIGSLTRQCAIELQDDERIAGAPFGPALPHEPIGPDGRIEGDVIFVADMGERNELLRARFGSRRWYRLSVAQPGDASSKALIVPY